YRGAVLYEHDRGFLFSTYVSWHAFGAAVSYAEEELRKRGRDLPIKRNRDENVGGSISDNSLALGVIEEIVLDPKLTKEELMDIMHAVLDDREQSIVESRFGLESSKPETLENIGSSLGVSKERVRQIEARAFKKLRREIEQRKQIKKIDILTLPSTRAIAQRLGITHEFIKGQFASIWELLKSLSPWFVSSHPNRPGTYDKPIRYIGQAFIISAMVAVPVLNYYLAGLAAFTPLWTWMATGYSVPLANIAAHSIYNAVMYLFGGPTLTMEDAGEGPEQNIEDIFDTETLLRIILTTRNDENMLKAERRLNDLFNIAVEPVVEDFEYAVQKYAISPKNAIYQLRRTKKLAWIVRLPMSRDELIQVIDSELERGMNIYSDRSGKLYLYLTKGVERLYKTWVVDATTGSELKLPPKVLVHAHPRFHGAEPSEGDKDVRREWMNLADAILVYGGADEIKLCLARKEDREFQAIRPEYVDEELIRLGILHPETGQAGRSDVPKPAPSTRYSAPKTPKISEKDPGQGRGSGVKSFPEGTGGTHGALPLLGGAGLNAWAAPALLVAAIPAFYLASRRASKALEWDKAYRASPVGRQALIFLVNALAEFINMIPVVGDILGNAAKDLAERVTIRLAPASFLVGIPASASPEVVEAVKASLGTRVTVVRLNDDEINAFTESEPMPGEVSMLLGSDITADMVRANLKRDANELLLLQRSDSTTRQEIVDAIIAMLPDIMSMDAANIFASAQEMAKRLPDLAQRMNNLRTLVDRRGNELSNIRLYNDTSMYDIPSSKKEVTMSATERIALSDPFLAQNMEKSRAPGAKAVIIYGDDFKDPDKIQAFARASGCDIDNIAFVNKYDRRGRAKSFEDLIAEISSITGVRPDNIGIRAAEGEIQGSVETGKLLEVKEININGVPTLLTLNSCQTLYRILKLMDRLPEESMALDGIIGTPGAYYDRKTGRITYMPPIVPIDWGIEQETIRNAVLLLSTSA
ncbi:MAG: sigma factor-like helix-turn-helix DNA-binding protein, partial [Candidatus Omnitrophica bacterium]|nr:sigma factor-like helix-turn-helix DNA-binding protein [Candidatus Omnitrophota bacterium]